MEELQIRRCKQTDCTIAKDGKCLESLPTEECPHFYWTDGEEESEDHLAGESKAHEEEKTINEGFKMYPGAAVSLIEMSTITYAHHCHKIVILGESESGKTTLLGYIFDRFQKGPFEDIYFAGSLTLRGFDERCHYSRTSSNSDIPHTEKTIIEAFDFLHLSLKKDIEKAPTHLLLSDISGEKLREAGHSSNLMLELDMLKYADKTIIVIDGKKVADKKIRQATIFSTQGFIQKALDDGIFTNKTDLQVVLSKWDYFVSDAEFNFESLIVEKFTKAFSARLGKLRFTKICASPKFHLDKIELGLGVYDLLNDWMIPKPIDEIVSLEKKSPGSSRYFLQFPY